MNQNNLAIALCRGLRGSTPQSHLSQRLGQRFNLVHRWESGNRPIRWREFLQLAEICGVSPDRALGPSLSLPPQGILDSLCHPHPQLSFSRFQLSRWRRGQVDPTLAQVLEIVDKTTPRLLPFLEGFVPLGAIAEVLPRAEARAAWAPGDTRLNPLAQLIRLPEYLSAPHSDDFLAKKWGGSPDQREGALLALENQGRIRWDGAHYRPQVLAGAPLILAASPEGLALAQQALPTAFAQLKTLIHGAPGEKTLLAELQLAIRPVRST